MGEAKKGLAVLRFAERVFAHRPTVVTLPALIHLVDYLYSYTVHFIYVYLNLNLNTGLK